MARLIVSATSLALLLALPVMPALAQTASREEAEAQMREINEAIAALQSELESERAEQLDEQQALKALDLDIQDNARQLRDLGRQRAEHDAELERLEEDRREFLDRLAANQDQLGQQILSAWRLGRESRIKLVLNQDSPAQLNRTLAYYEFFSRAQGQRIGDLRENLAGLDAIGEEIRAELVALGEIEEEVEGTEAQLQDRRRQRLAVLEALDLKIGSDEARLGELQKNQADLERVLERLSDALADIPADLGERLHPGQQRGQLPMPLRGRVLKAFGQQRGAGLEWQGWLIEARPGDEVRNVAYGRVAYADWLRGYGLLLIIDHGDGFMSLYGNNESLLAEVGDWVESGAAIASTGRAPGQDQGLYFELRNQGKAVDPAVWISRR